MGHFLSLFFSSDSSVFACLKISWKSVIFQTNSDGQLALSVFAMIFSSGAFNWAPPNLFLNSLWSMSSFSVSFLVVSSVLESLTWVSDNLASVLVNLTSVLSSFIHANSRWKFVADWRWDSTCSLWSWKEDEFKTFLIILQCYWEGFIFNTN